MLTPMKIVGIIIAVVVALLATVLLIGSMLPPTARSAAYDQCYNIKYNAYTAAEKAAAEDACAILMREADRKMGRIQ